jgi:MFS transporter, Spinster family, sphingosine-1-phosphate transporter
LSNPSSPLTPFAGPNPRVAIAILLLINLMNYVDRYVLSAVQSVIKTEFNATGQKVEDDDMGFLATAFLLSYMLTSPLFGRWADRMSRWKIIAIGVFVWSLASGASGFAQVYWMLLLTRVLVGIGEAAYGPTAPTIIADLYPVERRGSVLSWFYMAIPVGGAIGYGWGGLMSDLPGFGWRWAFYLSAPPGILLALWAFWMREPRRSHLVENAPPDKPFGWDELKLLARTPSFVYNTLGMTAMTFALGGISFWIPKYMAYYRGAGTLGDVNLKFGIITVVAGFTATLAGGYLGDKLRPRFSGSYFLVSGVGMLVATPLFIAFLVVPNDYAWVLVFLAEFCLFFNTGPTNTVLANVTHPSMRASAFAVNILIIHALGDAISPYLIGLMNKHTTTATAPHGDMNFSFGATVTLAIFLSGVFWILGAKHLARDTELAPTRLDNPS